MPRKSSQPFCAEYHVYLEHGRSAVLVMGRKLLMSIWDESAVPFSQLTVCKGIEQFCLSKFCHSNHSFFNLLCTACMHPSVTSTASP